MPDYLQKDEAAWWVERIMTDPDTPGLEDSPPCPDLEYSEEEEDKGEDDPLTGI